MNKEEIEELKEFTIDLTDIDELALGLEVCSKKSNMVIQEFAKLIIELEQQCKKQKEAIELLEKENKKYKEVIDRAIEYLETKRIREKAIVDIDVLEGILKEVK